MKKLIGLPEIVGVIGWGLIGAGLAMWSAPAALVVCGALLFGLAVLPRIGGKGK